MTAVIVIVIAVVVVGAAAVLIGRRRTGDGVDSFRRQIDALSPEARRPVVDQVQSVAEAQEATDADIDDAPDSAGDGDGDGDGDGA